MDLKYGLFCGTNSMSGYDTELKFLFNALRNELKQEMKHLLTMQELHTQLLLEQLLNLKNRIDLSRERI